MPRRLRREPPGVRAGFDAKGAGIDRVEVIRGPNSLLYGQSDAGGIINYITKRPRIRTTADARGWIRLASTNGFNYVFAIDVDGFAVGAIGLQELSQVNRRAEDVLRDLEPASR